MSEVKVSDELKANYDGYYTDREAVWRDLGAVGKTENIERLCRRVAHQTVLEVGAGDGALLQRLSQVEFGERLFGVEISASGVARVEKRKIPRLVECRLFDGYQVPYPDGAFDIAILSHVVEHVEHPRQLIHDVARVAKHVFVEVPLEDTLRLRGNFVFDRVGHINYYSPVTIRRLLQSCGLTVLDERVTNSPKATYVYAKGRAGLFDYYLKEALRSLSPGLSSRLFVYHGALLCRSPSV
jgi:hypothetical protein